MAAKHQAKYKEAGAYLKRLRVASGHYSRDAFSRQCGDRLSYDRISKLEVGRVEPKASDLVVYFQVTECPAIALLKIPL